MVGIWVLISMKMNFWVKFIFIWKVLQQDSFWNRGQIKWTRKWLIIRWRKKSSRFLLWFPVTGTFPLQLSCSYPGKWFTIKSVSKQSIDGKWKKVPAAKSVSERDCKASRIVQQGRAGSYCTVSGSLPEISAVDEVKVEYYCWEISKIIWTHFRGIRLCQQTSSQAFSPGSPVFEGAWTLPWALTSLDTAFALLQVIQLRNKRENAWVLGWLVTRLVNP